VVVPAEHATHYSESLLLLPPSYQISFYTRHDSAELQETLAAYTPHTNLLETIKSMKRRLRRLHGLPADATAVFCNFNKVDKLDLHTLSVWMNVLRSVPGSVLWLLHASVHSNGGDPAQEQKQQQNEEVIYSIRHACAAAGVSPARIIFASRVNKRQHLARQLAADLFLDSFVYGAHSTATDALRGGLPVLTVVGGTFPSRVGASLYASLRPGVTVRSTTNINQDNANKRLSQEEEEEEEDRALCSHMVRTSVKDFELFAAHVVTKQPELLLKMSQLLARTIVENRGIFNIEISTRNFLRGMEALKESRHLQHQHSEHSKLQVPGVGNAEKKRKYSVFMTV